MALPALCARFPGRDLAAPAGALRHRPVVTQNDLFELPVRLNARVDFERAPSHSVADTPVHEDHLARPPPRVARRQNPSLDG
ncbi:hypothetical protein ACH41H_35250 [Streptomyces sp. NPDC020800]|uniref:hypothetical protein n=1 Tax=Streptomyces sp. NPDC020800 TaxID=3365092 RepID=UPI003795B7DB